MFEKISKMIAQQVLNLVEKYFFKFGGGFTTKFF